MGGSPTPDMRRVSNCNSLIRRSSGRTSTATRISPIQCSGELRKLPKLGISKIRGMYWWTHFEGVIVRAEHGKFRHHVIPSDCLVVFVICSHIDLINDLAKAR